MIKIIQFPGNLSPSRRLAMTMTRQESDRILNETTHIGNLEVTIEGVGTAEVDMPFPAPLRLFIGQLACVALKKTVISHTANIPWLLVSYDKEANKLVVKNK